MGNHKSQRIKSLQGNKLVCDSDYRGEYIVAIHNDSDIDRIIEPGERIAQFVLMPYIPMTFEEVDELNETKRGVGGFNSTGKF